MDKKRRNWIELFLIASLVIFVGVHLVLDMRKNKEYRAQIDRLHTANSVLFTDINAANETIIVYTKEKKLYSDSVVSLKEELIKLKIDYEELVADKEGELAEADTIPTEEVYARLQVLYPDTGDLEYLFSMKQIKGIYTTSITSRYQEWQISSLMNRLSVRGAIIAAQDSIISIGEQTLSQYEYNETHYTQIVSNKDEEIYILGRKIKDSKVKIGVAGLVGVVIGFIIAR